MKTDELYDEMLTTLGAMNTPETEKMFLMSLKKVVSDLNRKLKEDVVSPTRIDSNDIGFEAYADNVFHSGCKFYMQRDGGWAQDPDAESFGFYENQLRKVIGAAISANDSFLTRNQTSA